MSTGTKAGGQALLGGLDCTVHRNFFGAQIRSFVTKLKAPACMEDFGPELEDFRAVFIRLDSTSGLCLELPCYTTDMCLLCLTL